MAWLSIVLAILSSLQVIAPPMEQVFKALAVLFNQMSGGDSAKVDQITSTAISACQYIEVHGPEMVDTLKTLYGDIDAGLQKLLYVRDQLMTQLGLDKHQATTAAQNAAVVMKTA